MDASRVDVEIAVATTVFLAVVRDSIVARAATVPHAAATMISCAAAMLVAAQRDRSASPPAPPKCAPSPAPPPAKERREVSAPQDNTAARARELAHSAVLKARAATHLAAMHEPSISWGLLARGCARVDKPSICSTPSNAGTVPFRYVLRIICHSVVQCRVTVPKSIAVDPAQRCFLGSPTICVTYVIRYEPRLA